MADLAKFQQETTAAYQPAYDSLQKQLGALDTKLASTNADIKKQYAQQQAGLDRQRNQAAEAASMRAAGSGGSFGGAANIANRKYYEQTYVPAQQSLNASQSAAYKSAQEARDNSYDSLNNQLAQLQAEANKYALQRYDAAVEAERQAAEAEKNRQAAAASYGGNAWGYTGGGGGAGDKYGFDVNGSNYTFKNNNTGALVRMGTYVNQFGGDFNGRAYQVLSQMAASGDYYAQVAKAAADKAMAKGGRLAWSGGGGKNTYSGNSLYDNVFNTLGIKIVDSKGNLFRG